MYYKRELVGEYFADMLICDNVIVELKAVQELSKLHEVQLVNYFCATGKDVGLPINFGDSVHVRRKYRIYRPKQ